MSSSGDNVPIRGSGSGGDSSWGAGQDSFKPRVQSKGIWKDGSAVGRSLEVTSSEFNSYHPLIVASGSSSDLERRSSISKAMNIRPNSVPGAAHLSRAPAIPQIGTSPPGRRQVLRVSGGSSGVSFPRGRAVSPEGIAGRREPRRSPLV